MSRFPSAVARSAEDRGGMAVSRRGRKEARASRAAPYRACAGHGTGEGRLKLCGRRPPWSQIMAMDTLPDGEHGAPHAPPTLKVGGRELRDNFTRYLREV